MDNKTIWHKKVICQCLSLLPLEGSPFLDYRMKKLSTESLIKIFVAAQLDDWNSYADMEEKLRAHKKLREFLDLSSISGSQLSRRLNDLPTEWIQEIFGRVIAKVYTLTNDSPGLDGGIGKLRIIDATHIKLPAGLCDWAFVSKEWTVVKMHTRLVVTSADTVFPDRILPSTGTIGDPEGSDVLIEESDATYVMDRGYISFKRINQWLNMGEKGVDFVIRLKDNHNITVIKENDLPGDPIILKDAEIQLGQSTYRVKKPLRLVEYKDEKGQTYRIATTRRDLTAVQIAEIYHHRWAIETFFKWIKQHLRLIKIHSTKPQGIWNQMFLALMAYGAALIVKLETKTRKSIFEALRLIRTYADKGWNAFLKELNRKPTRTSKGRQKVPKNKEPVYPFVGTVAKVTWRHKWLKKK